MARFEAVALDVWKYEGGKMIAWKLSYNDIRTKTMIHIFIFFFDYVLLSCKKYILHSEYTILVWLFGLFSSIYSYFPIKIWFALTNSLFSPGKQLRTSAINPFCLYPLDWVKLKSRHSSLGESIWDFLSATLFIWK